MYIENSKTIIRDGTEEEKRSAVDTLYTALDSALRLIHPYMPFLSEEMWQRLPRRPKDETKSIVMAAYPEYDASLNDPESERAYELILGCSKGIRSLISEYGIKEDAKAYVQAWDNEAYQTASSSASAIKTLSGKQLNNLSILEENESVPAGCAVYPVSASVAVFLDLKSKAEPEKEIGKLKPKIGKTSDAIKEQQRVLGTLGEKVSAHVRGLEEGKLRDLRSEMRMYEESLEKFEELKLG